MDIGAAWHSGSSTSVLLGGGELEHRKWELTTVPSSRG